MKASILEYLGKWEGGILVQLSLEWEGNFYEGIFYYTQDQMIITPDDNLLKKLNGPIELWEGYLPLMEEIINLVEPYEDIYEDLDEIEN